MMSLARRHVYKRVTALNIRFFTFRKCYMCLVRLSYYLSVHNDFKKMEVDKLQHFRKCASQCPHFITGNDAHNLCVLFRSRARSVSSRGSTHCDRFAERKLRSRLALFVGDGSQASVPHGSCPTAAEAVWRLPSWGSQTELAEEFETGLSLSLRDLHMALRS